MDACGKLGFSHQRAAASDGENVFSFRNLFSTTTITAFVGLLLLSTTFSVVNATETATEIVLEKKE